MKKLVVCRVCGYVMEEGKVGDRCPACGVPATAFQEYTPVMKPKRELWLSFDVHPVLVHFPVAFTVATLVLSVISLLFTGTARGQLDAAVLVLSVLLPFTVIVSAAAGIVDGKVRFKRINTPLLVRKIILGVVFLSFSAAMIVLILVSGLGPAGVLIAFLLCNAGALVCAIILGLIGRSIACARTPG
ncbi:MAG: hypothetical protein JXD23_06900 [Spirochaetales bacterium]|nr:hypothetical protein [Spirochaetales bacterium]